MREREFGCSIAPSLLSLSPAPRAWEVWTVCDPWCLKTDVKWGWDLSTLFIFCFSLLYKMPRAALFRQRSILGSILYSHLLLGKSAGTECFSMTWHAVTWWWVSNWADLWLLGRSKSILLLLLVLIFFKSRESYSLCTVSMKTRYLAKERLT